MIKSTSVYFDGTSSFPQTIELNFNEIDGTISFNTVLMFSNTWAFEEVSFEYSGDSLTIFLKENPERFIKVTNPDFLAAFHTYRKENGKLNWYHKLINLGVKVHIALAIAFLGLIALAYFFLVPIIAEKAVILIPQKYDIEMGNSFYDQYLKYVEIDSAKTESLNLFASELKLRNTQELNFVVVQSEEVNAFALPNGTIVVYTGLIKEMKHYPELVGLIGHEVSHVNNRHTMKMMCRNLSGYILISAILSDVNGIMAILGDNIRSLQSLSYSRQFERQADSEGLEIMYLNNVNPKGITDLFSHLKSKHDIAIPEFLSTHPITDERINDINKLIKNKLANETDNPKLKALFEAIKK